MILSPTLRRLVALVLVPSLLLGLTGCAQEMRRELRSRNEVLASGKSRHFLKAYMRDGTAYEFDRWQVDTATRVITGIGRVSNESIPPPKSDALTDFGGRPRPAPGTPLSIPADSVIVFETDTPAGMPPVLLAITIIVGAALAVGAAKAVFGSCPTFYVSDGERALLQAEGFSSSIAPSLEDTDVDALFRARPAGRDVEVTMLNEALETHVVRFVRLLAFTRPEGGRVLASVDGRYREAFDWTPPASAAGPEGDCAAALASFDGAERFSATDSTDLAAHETLDLTFDRPPAGDLGLVLVSRQGLLATYLFYQSLAYMGRSAGRYLAAYERGDAATRARVAEHVSGISRTLGGIDVWVKDARGRWTMVQRVKETGPIACDVRLVPLPRPAAGPMRVQLRLARGHWRIDQVALVRLGAAVAPRRLEPATVFHDGVEDAGARAALLDSARTLVTQPGDEYRLAYRLPDDGREHELFLESRGYYLEWLRDPWLAEEDAGRSRLLLTNPRKALRLIAPEYKRLEPEIERHFWSSRFARP